MSAANYGSDCINEVIIGYKVGKNINMTITIMVIISIDLMGKKFKIRVS